jgi:hypothetical protein
VVGWLTAVQSQDYGGATWAIAQRTVGSTQGEIDELVDEGAIIRTHVLRPTWHFVLADDIRWLLDLTGPRIRAGLASRHRQLEIDGDVIARANEAFTEALSGGRSLTRPELGDVLQRSSIVSEGQRLPHLLAAAELEGVVVSGPRRGKQHTYSLLAERAPGARCLGRQEALAELTRRYFRSHGPAQVQDAVWWSGLTTSDVRTGIALAGEVLAHQVLDGKDYWFDAEADPVPGVVGTPPRAPRRPQTAWGTGLGEAHLLPNWDEYTVGYRDRSAAIDPGVPFDPALFSFGSILSNVVTIGGRVRGSWRRTGVGQRVRIDVRPLAPLAPVEVDAVARVGDRMSRFLGRPVELAGIGP